MQGIFKKIRWFDFKDKQFMTVNNISSIAITPYSDINKVLLHFMEKIKIILEDNFWGMYLYGSLATGGFDPKMSDIDFIVITKEVVSDKEFSALHELHKQFYSSNSPWAHKVEAAYIAKKELGNYENAATLYPQIEKGRELIKEKLEMGWSFQCHTLYEYGIAIDGPEPHKLFEPVNEKNMLQAAKSIINLWKEQARDEREAHWLIQREEQAFVILTLCRFLYFISERKIASKQLSAQWACTHLSKKWHKLIQEAINKNNQPSIVPENDVKETADFIDHVALILNN